MIGQCPRCEARIELPESGAYQCPRCRGEFNVFVAPSRGTPAVPSPSAPESAPPLPSVFAPPAPTSFSAAPPVEGRCANHPENPALGVCERCGDFMCGVCQTVVEGRRYCPRCFDLLYTRGSLQFTQQQFNQPTNALVLGILSIASMACTGCYGLFSLPTGIIAVVLGIGALREIERRPDLPGRGRAIAAIVCGALGILATIALGVFVGLAFYQGAKGQ